MSILDRIVADKRTDVAQRMQLFPSSYWEASPLLIDPLMLCQNVLEQVPLELLQNISAVPLQNKTSIVRFLSPLWLKAMKTQEFAECLS